jgi:hypothetical protein
MKNKKIAVIAGLIFGLVMGIFYSFQYGIIHGSVSGIVAGFLFGLLIYFFTTSKKINKQMEVEITETDTLIHSGAANHFLKREGVGGKLYLFADRLQFQSHNFNLQNHGLIIKTPQIKQVTTYNVLGFVPTGLVILTTEGKKEKFVLSDRNTWKTEIEKLITKELDINSQ